MGLFGKKKNIPEGIRVMFYEGDLPGFSCNFPCQIFLGEEYLRITRMNPQVEVKLPRSRLLSIDVFSEQDYMQKFKGNAGSALRRGDVNKGFYVIYYLDKEGNKKHIDVWAVSFEAQKMWKLRETIAQKQGSMSYEI